MEFNIAEVATRIRGLRLILDMSEEELAEVTGVSVEEYRQSELGNRDFSFTFLYKCAKHFGVDITELLTGDMPKLSSYTLVRAGEGLPIQRRQGFKYQHLAYLFKDKIAEPFLVTAKYNPEDQGKPIALSTHVGQEMDYVLKGTLLVQIGDHQEVVRAGDAVYYDSSRGHGMIAIEGEDCEFLAIVMQK